MIATVKEGRQARASGRLPRKRSFQCTPAGKRFEANVINSIRQAGYKPKVGITLDHIMKLDFVLALNDEVVGVQISLRNDPIKAAAAKHCAMPLVDRFIYLTLPYEIFSNPSRRYGALLTETVSEMLTRFRYPALFLNITRKGLYVREL